MFNILDKIKPKIKDCADDVSKYSADRIFSHSLPKFTDMFEDFNESLSLSSHSGLFFNLILLKNCMIFCEKFKHFKFQI